MIKTLDRLWRMTAQAIAFAVFGLGSIVLVIVVFPPLGLITSNRDLTHKRARYIIYRAFRLYIWFVKVIGLFDITVDGAERLENGRGCLIVANHPTLLDVVILMALGPNFQCVVKHQLWQNFFLRGVVSAAGFIRNDLSADEFLEQCTEAFDAGYNLIVFPEGTRTVPGENPKFVRGFANIAILSQADLQIVVIRCEPITLTRNKPWYFVPPTIPKFRVAVGEIWGVDSYEQTPHRALNARSLAKNLESYYHKALSNG